MAGRKPLVSAIFCQFKVQLNLRASDTDVALETDMKRLIDLVQAKRADGVMPQYVVRALLNQMLMDERGLAGLESLTQPRETAVDPHVNQALETVQQPYLHRASNDRQPPATAPDHQAAQGTSVPKTPAEAERVISEALKALEIDNTELPPPPKRRMGKSAMNAMG